MLRLNSKPKFKLFSLILAMNTCLISFRNTFNKTMLYLNVLLIIHLNKMALLNAKNFLDMTRKLLLQAFVPSKFWIHYCVFNQSPSFYNY